MIVQPATFDSEARFWWKSAGSCLRSHMELEETTPGGHQTDITNYHLVMTNIAMENPS